MLISRFGWWSSTNWRSHDWGDMNQLIIRFGLAKRLERRRDALEAALIWLNPQVRASMLPRSSEPYAISADPADQEPRGPPGCAPAAPTG